MQNIKNQIVDFIQDNFVFDEDIDLADTDSLLDAGLIDSTGVLELVGFLEETFGIEVLDADIIPENLDTIDAIHAFVKRAVGNQGESTTLEMAS